MSSKKNLANINKFIVKLVGMMKVSPILFSNSHQSSIGVIMVNNFRFTTFSCSSPKYIPNISPLVTINPSLDK